MAAEDAAGKRKLVAGSGGGRIRGGKRPRRHDADWAGLPDDILFCIFRAVFLSGAYGFAAACRSWRAVAAASRKALASATPPLLLRPAWGEAAMCPSGPVAARRRWRPGRTRPRLHVTSPGANAALPGAGRGGLLLPPLPPRFLRTRAVCQSRGYLITVDGSTGRPVLTNPLTGQELRPFPPLREPPFRDGSRLGMTGAVLGDPASPAGGCRIVLYCGDSVFLTCTSGAAAAWDTTEWGYENTDYPLQLAAVRGRAYGLLSSGDLLLFDYVLSFRCIRMAILEETDAFRAKHKMGPFLAEHDGKVFTVHCTFLPQQTGMVRFRVCRLVKRRWVEQERLDGMALFVDVRGSVVLRANPSKWGAKESHVYVSGWLWDSWKVFPFGDSIRSEDIPMHDRSIEACWPTPCWVLPCSCY